MISVIWVLFLWSLELESASQWEIDILEELYHSTRGNNWVNNGNWLVGDPCTNNWAGIQCDAGHVVSIELPDGNLTGTIPISLGNLTHLQYLVLKRNELLIPNLWQYLTHLQHLDISFACIQICYSSTLPTTLGILSRLTHLDLSGNDFTDQTIPSQIGKLTLLNLLGLSDAGLVGTIPSEIGLLDGVTLLNLRNNDLSGTIPDLTRMRSLVSLFLNVNNFDPSCFDSSNTFFRCDLQLIPLVQNCTISNSDCLTNIQSNCESLICRDSKCNLCKAGIELVFDDFSSDFTATRNLNNLAIEIYGKSAQFYQLLTIRQCSITLYDLDSQLVSQDSIVIFDSTINLPNPSSNHILALNDLNLTNVEITVNMPSNSRFQVFNSSRQLYTSNVKITSVTNCGDLRYYKEGNIFVIECKMDLGWIGGLIGGIVLIIIISIVAYKLHQRHIREIRNSLNDQTVSTK